MTLTKKQVTKISAALSYALAVCEEEAEQRGSEDQNYCMPAGDACDRLRDALKILAETPQ